MNRRKFLLGVVVVASSFSGCLGSRNNDTNIEYEQCDLSYVPLVDLPTPVKEEVNTAIKNEVYETDGELVLSEVIDIDESYITEYEENEWVYYDMTITTDTGVTRLRADETHPKTSLPAVENRMETEVTVDIRIEYEGDLVFKDEISLAEGEVKDYRYSQAGSRYGQYRAIYKIKTGKGSREEEVSWRQNHVQSTDKIMITPEKLEPGTKWRAPLECEWNDEGELVSGPGQ